MLAENLQNLIVSQELTNSASEFKGVHFFWVEKLGKFLGGLQFLKIFLEEET
jgi:hypothetical protein